jgi:glycosyltransferase involved in cell wall biosynthesis
MRIAFVGHGHSADPCYIGGQQSYLRRLATTLTNGGHDVDFFVLLEPGQQSQRAAQDGIAPAHRFRRFSDLVRSLSTTPYDYVQLTRFPLRYYPALAQFLGWLRYHTSVGYLYVVYPPRAIMRLLRLLLFKTSFDLVFAISPRLHKSLISTGIRSVLLLPPVPESFFATRRLDVPSLSPKRVCYLGRIAADKGIPELIVALEQLRRHYPEVEIVIRGYYYPRSRQSVELHHDLEKRNLGDYQGRPYGSDTYYSHDKESQILTLLQATDLMLLPYRRLDGVTLDVPLLLVEAMAAGCAVVTTPIADLPEIVGDPALVAPVPAFAERITALIESKELVEKQVAMRERARVLGVDEASFGESFLSATRLG